MQNPRWMDRISAMTANSGKLHLPSTLPKWKLSLSDIYKIDCSWRVVKATISKNPLEDFIVWYRDSKELPWNKVVSMHIATTCACGRDWEENGVVFTYKGEFNKRQYSYEDMLEWLNSPIRCKFCFYKEQHANGEWAPKSVIKELES